MANYGDVALGLPSDWSRSKYENQSDWMLGTVGHTDGEADAYLTDEPEKEHQFRWVDWHDANELIKAQLQGYVWVKKDSWTKHPVLWNWDAEDYVAHAGQRLMARPKELWLADEAKRESTHKQSRKDSEQENEAIPKGLIALDAEGKTVKRSKRGI